MGMPISVTGPHALFLLALWNMPPYRDDANAVRRYHPLLTSRPAVIAGDFNSAMMLQRRGDAPLVWGDPARQKDPEFFLGDTPSVSAYHKFSHEAPGAETRPTHYCLYRRSNRFHYDYCFIPKSWRLTRVRVGTFDSWVNTRLSDHVPLIVDVHPTAHRRSDARLAA
jgi:endonuclease/exonuclease/phosphatase family metal-dependent hydrolase